MNNCIVEHVMKRVVVIRNLVSGEEGEICPVDRLGVKKRRIVCQCVKMTKTIILLKNYCYSY